MTGQHTETHCHCGKPRGTSDHCEFCGCEEYERTCTMVWHAPVAFDEGTIIKVLEAVRVNARRAHFSELYEGFNDCPRAQDESNKCDCGKAEAEDALRALGECPHPSWQGYPQSVCTECGIPDPDRK